MKILLVLLLSSSAFASRQQPLFIGTTAEKSAIAAPKTNQVVYDLTLDQFQKWNGSSWIQIAAGGGGGGGPITTDSITTNTPSDSLSVQTPNAAQLTGSMTYATGNASGGFNSGGMTFKSGTSSSFRGSVTFDFLNYIFTTHGLGESIIPSSNNSIFLGTHGNAWSQVYSQDIVGNNRVAAGDITLGFGALEPTPFVGLPGSQTAVVGLTGFGAFGAPGAVSMYTQNDNTANSTATANVYIESGNKTAGTGNSGDIITQTGTSAGGVRGSYKIASPLVLQNSLTFTNRVSTSGTTTISAVTDFWVGINFAGAAAANLPACTDGLTYIIKDTSGAASTNNITINRAGSDTFEGGGTTKVINTNFGFAKLNCKTAVWYQW